MAAQEQDPGLPTQAIWDIPYDDLVINETIGKGSFGSVFKGTYLGVDVAIKRIDKADDPEYLKYIDREVSMLQSIRHPFIVQFSGICVHATGLYIITEFVSGGDVRKMLKTTPSLSWRRKIRISIDLAKAMLFLHSKKIIHRDLKSKNILLDEHGRIRLCDFGFARMSENKRNKHMTMCGTEGWVAPEILLGMSYDNSCDVFSYGVVLAELVTVKKPGVDLWVRTADNCFDIHPDELRNKALPGCPSKLADLCIECCQYEPLLRPKFEDVIKALTEIEKTLPPEETKKPAPMTSTTTTTPTMTPTLSNSNVLSSPAPSSPPSSPHAVMGSMWKPGARNRAGTGARRTTSIAQPPPAQAMNVHLIKMVERATTDYYYDVQYIQDLLLTFRCFTTPQCLFEILLQRFQPEQNMNEAQQKSHRVIQLRVLIFLKRWIDGYWQDFSEPGMDDLLDKFEKMNANNQQQQSDEVKFTALLTRKRHGEISSSQSTFALTQPTTYPQSWFPTNEVIETHETQAQEMARQIALIQSYLFTAIHPREYLQYCAERAGVVGSCWINGNPDDLIAPNLHSYHLWSEHLSRLVATDVLKFDTKPKRVATIERWLDIALFSVSLKNFDAVFSIVGGLRSPSIERLADTFKGVSSSYLKKFEELKELTSKQADYKNYQNALAAAAPPTLPYFDSILEEMWYMECSSPKSLNQGIINFFHYRQIARKVSQCQQYLPAPYSFRPVAQLQKHLNRPEEEVMDDDQLKQRSLQIEEPSYV